MHGNNIFNMRENISLGRIKRGYLKIRYVEGVHVCLILYFFNFSTIFVAKKLKSFLQLNVPIVKLQCNMRIHQRMGLHSKGIGIDLFHRMI